MAIQSKGANRIQRAIDKREPFKQASMSGRHVYGTPGATYGQLPQEWVDRLSADIASAPGATFVYAVFSYETPIAWFADGKWTIPSEHYSHTTSNHQGIVRVAAGNPGFYSQRAFA